jgi:hypothetical protein
MGIEIADYHQEAQETSSVQVAALLTETKNMSPEELKCYFEKLFSRMNPQAKEALTEILWVGLNPSEQQQFQMPYFGSRLELSLTKRWSQDSITAALNNPFTQSTGVVSSTQRRTFSGQSPLSSGREEQLLEDHFFTILREAIHRADTRPRVRPAPRTRGSTVDMEL